MSRSWTKTPPMTDQQIQELILSVSAYIKPSTPCAKYNEVMNMKHKYQAQYGVSQLAKDYELAQQRMKRGKNDNDS